MKLHKLMLVVVAFAACGPLDVGSRYIKSKPVNASEGALITVSADESPELNGTILQIPAGALTANTVVTVELGLNSILGAELAAGPDAVFGPVGTIFNSDVMLTLPVSQLDATDDVGIVGLDANGTTFEVDASQVALDSTRTRATFRIRQLAHYQPRRRAACSSNASCATGLQCVNGRCQAPPSSTNNNDGGPNTSCPMNCPSGSTCDPTRLVCVVQPNACQTSMDCPTNFSCQSGVCLPPVSNTCGMNAACAAGQACQNGVCIPVPSDGGTTNPNACMSNADCFFGQACVSGVCRTQCVPANETCNGIDDDCDGQVDEGCNPVDAGVMCGGFAGLQCPSNLDCVDDPSDNCDPARGGQDCNGLCVVPPVNDGGMAPDAGNVDAGVDGGVVSDGGVDGGVVPDAGVDGGSAQVCRTTMDCFVGQCINGLCQ